MIHGSQAVMLFAGFLFLMGLISAGPTIVALANALIPLVLVVALAVGVLRLVWHHTNRDI